jgi:hypothetical protein
VLMTGNCDGIFFVGLFGSLNQQKPTTNFFSNTTTSNTPAFGATNTGFSFNNPTNQATSVFGANNNPVSTAGGLGTTSAFSFGQPQSQASVRSFFTCVDFFCKDCLN